LSPIRSKQAGDVLKRAGREEVLLGQPQLLSAFRFIIRIKNVGDGFRYDLLVHLAWQIPRLMRPLPRCGQALRRKIGNSLASGRERCRRAPCTSSCASPAMAVFLAGSADFRSGLWRSHPLRVRCELSREHSGCVRWLGNHSRLQTPMRPPPAQVLGLLADHPLLTVRTATEFSRDSSTSSVSWRMIRRSPSRNAYSTFSRPISISSNWPR
jgi:hypothetical protein